jgi:transcriptional regulator with XRE-family HTH domain
MHVQTNARRVHLETDKSDAAKDFYGTTLQDIGTYLQNLRENMRVTQASLSTKTGAMAGHKISRSRISEIENAKRDRVSERELRVYMIGLKCTPHHINRMVKVLRECTVTPPREYSADPVLTSSATPDPYPAGLAGAEDDLILRKEKSDDDPPTTGHEEKGHERWSQEDTPINLFDGSQPPPSRRRWQRRRIALAAATALTVGALTGLGAELFPRRESADPPTTLGSPTALLVQSPNSPRILDDTSGFIKNTTFPDPALVRVNQRSAQTSKIQDRPGLGDTASSDTTKHLVGHCCVHEAQDHAVGVAALPRVVEPDWHSYTTGARGGWRPDLDGEQLMKDTER